MSYVKVLCDQVLAETEDRRKVPSISNGRVRSSSGGLSRAAVWWISRIRSSRSGGSTTTSYLTAAARWCFEIDAVHPTGIEVAFHPDGDRGTGRNRHRRPAAARELAVIAGDVVPGGMV